MSRLIDADKLYDYISDVFTQFGDVMSVKDALKAVENAPTVIAVELPCVVGDTMYEIFNGKIRKRVVHEITIGVGNAVGLLFGHTLWSGISSIGKTVFLTREEAEQALKETIDNDM